jgi:hypothetical protein
MVGCLICGEVDVRKELRARAEAAYCLAKFIGNFERCVAPHTAELDATPSQQPIACLFEVRGGHSHYVESKKAPKSGLIGLKTKKRQTQLSKGYPPRPLKLGNRRGWPARGPRQRKTSGRRGLQEKIARWLLLQKG